MKALTSLTKKYLILNKKRTIVTIVGIILSCALIGGVANLVSSFQNFMINIAIEDNGPQFATYKNVPIDQAKYIEHNANIKESFTTVDLGFAWLEGSKNPNKPFLSISAFDSESFDKRNIKLVNGRLPKNSNELVINSQINENDGIKYKIGDKIILNVGKRMLGDEVLTNSTYPIADENGNQETFVSEYTKEYTIVGIIEKPSFEQSYLPGYTVITYLDQDLLNTINTININVISKNPKTCYEDLSKIAKDLKISELDFNDNLLRWYGVTSSDNANGMLYTMASILIIVIMIASIIVIYNSFTISITERKKQFGMLASIGATSRQLRNMVVKEGLILSLIGIPLGIICSIVGIGVTLMVINNLGIFEGFYESRLTLAVSIPALLITVGVSSLTIFLSSLIPAIKVSHTSPIEAIRLTEDIKIKGKKVKTSKLTRILFGIEGELGLKNMKRNKKKYRSTIISLFVSIVLFMTISAFANYTFRSALKVYKDYNYNVVIYNTTGGNLDDFYNKVSKLDNINEYSKVKYAYMETYFKKSELNSKVVDSMLCDDKTGNCSVGVLLTTLGDETFKNYVLKNKFKLSDYTDSSNPKAIIMKKSTYRDSVNDRIYEIALLNAKEGSTIDLYYSANDKSVFANKLVIGEYSTIYPIGFNNDSLPVGSIQGFITDDFYKTLPDSVKEGNYMYINGNNLNKLVKEIKALAESNGAKVSILNIDEESKQMKNVILALDIFLYGFITLVALITVTNIINTITTSIYLRRREFAMIKAVGMTNKDFNKMIAYESIFYGIKGATYGVVVGTLIDYLLYKNVNSVFVYDYVLPYKSIIVSVIFVFIIISITMIYAVRKIRNDNIIDVIKQENV